MTTFKVSTATNEDSAADALENLNLDGDDISDDYDFMDDADGRSNGRRRPQRTESQRSRKKYIEMLQHIADRQLSEICIDLDDIATVRATSFTVTLNFLDSVSAHVS